ncbi:MAG: bifunctional transcriptional activator/DNA repair protein Ada [Polyangiaceae bacterium]|nr:bifunctional transcriptional activator/DNA repair protein Ada [Polyangiaceae bacterium]
MERAYLAGDATYRGLFFLGVKTTGIFCNPGCPAKKPLPKNVEYFGSARDAMTAGYRPCKRCEPLRKENEPDWIKTLLTEVERDKAAGIKDSELAERGFDPTTVRRYFQRTYGMTFQAFMRARRLSQAMTVIREGRGIDDAVFESGYESHSGFRDAFVRAFGKTPGSTPVEERVFVSRIQTPLGPMVAAATAEGVCLLEFADRRMLEKQLTTVGKLFGGPFVPERNSHLERLNDELTAYFEKKLIRFNVPLVFPGTPFQKRVWEALLNIEHGQTRSYEELATSIGDSKAVRAVGHANGLNRIAIVIPCHRVVNKNGKLGGYGGGLRRKEYLLALEKAGEVQIASQ